MRVLKRSPWLSGLGLVLASCVLFWGQAAADVATDRTGSIVIFPKVIADGTRDTLIQLTNTANNNQYAHCFYVNLGGVCQFNTDVQCDQDRDCPQWEDLNEQCERMWQEDDFDVLLTRQQPTIWRVSTGRVVDPSDPTLRPGDPLRDSCEIRTIGGTDRQSCPGIDPGNIIPAPAQPFRGELKCILVDESGGPSNGNWLKGEAIIELLDTPQISKYNSINILAANDPPRTDTTDWALKLNNSEYNACPGALEAVHYADQAGDVVANALDPSSCPFGGCPVSTVITLLPCTQDFEMQQCVSTTAQFTVYDEQEIPMSASEEVECWIDSWLGEIGDSGNVFSSSRGTFLRTRIRPAVGTRCIAGPNLNLKGCTSDDDCGGAANGGVCGPSPGLLGIVEELHVGVDPNTLLEFFGTAATNMHMVGKRTGRCRGSLTVCDSDDDCSPNGRCHVNGAPCDEDADCDTSVPGPGPLNRCDLCIMDAIYVPEVVPSPVPTP